MREPVEFQPWTIHWGDLSVILLGGAILILSIYLAARGGRDRPEATEAPGKPPIRWYAGIVGIDANPITVFIILISAVLLIWAFVYIFYIGAHGLYY